MEGCEADGLRIRFCNGCRSFRPLGAFAQKEVHGINGTVASARCARCSCRTRARNLAKKHLEGSQPSENAGGH